MAYAELLCSLGPLLKFAELKDLPATLCNQVVSACSNIRCRFVLDWYDGNAGVDKFSALGPLIAELTWDMTEDDTNDSSLELAARSCSCLESIKLYGAEDSSENLGYAILQLLCAKRPQLTSLVLVHFRFVSAGVINSARVFFFWRFHLEGCVRGYCPWCSAS